MIKSYYKIADHLKICALGTNVKAGDMKFLTKVTYLKTLEKLMRKGFNYVASRQCWERVNEDNTTDIIFFADYITE